MAQTQTANRESVSANARRQAVFAEKMRAAGRKRIALWLTSDEERLVRRLLEQRQTELQLESEFGVKIDPQAAHQIPTSLRDFTIQEVSPTMASKMVRLWHSALPNIPATNIQRNRRYACFALVCNGYAYAIAVYSSPVNRHLDDGATVELRRLAISDKCPRNTATWFMARCEKQLQSKMPEIKRLVSYQDTTKHTGTIYKAGNWHNAADVRYVSWARTRTDRAPSQSKSAKVRWEKQLNS
ncbi:Mom family adenine methylcarbamoylation protein [Chitinimonas lacunae]|uniref:Uncharacterized protein n=1 Tax=Chitinimonas lacunae TaxID=1963018 RepID=A0ABV8MYZ8_9NEIS